MSRKMMLLTFSVLLIAALVGGFTMAWFTAKADAPENEFTAGTVMIEAGTTYLYGVQYKEGQSGEIYEIYIDRDENVVTYAKLFDSNKTGLNALAHDNDNNRLYYVDNPTNDLLFYELATGSQDNIAGDLKDKLGTTKRVYGAAYGMGAYWFIFEETDDLWRITFNPDGTINAAESDIYHEGFTDGARPDGFGFGDIAMELREGILYASTSGTPGPELYFTYNVYTREYNELTGANATNLQLAYGGDGVLYGHETREFTWYEVNPETGAKTLFYTDSPDGKMFSDLACSYQGNWNPGDCEVVRYRITNTGSKNSYVKFELEASWEFDWGYIEDHWEELCFSETYDGLEALQAAVAAGESVVEIGLCQSSEGSWIEGNGTFYYNGVVEPGDSVVLCLTICLKGAETGNAYQGATYTLKAQARAIQSSNDAIDEVDGWEPLR